MISSNVRTKCRRDALTMSSGIPGQYLRKPELVDLLFTSTSETAISRANANLDRAV